MAALPIAGLLLMPFFLVPGIALAAAVVAANIVIYYLNSLRLESELESMRYFSSLLFGAKSLQRKTGHAIQNCGFDLGSAIKPFKKLGGMIPGKTRQALAELEAMTVIFKAVFLVDLIRYNRTISAMLKHRKELNELFSIVGEADSAISVASFRQSLKHYCLPEFYNENSISFQGMYHPLIAEPIANSGEVGASSLITGSNASGKSTFIKALAVNNILAQTIYTCCASQYRLRFSYVATSMALRDNIVGGESYFVAEIKSLKRIVACARAQYCTCFIDEILRGTNTRERIAAGAAVLKLLHETDSLFIVASHDIELTEILSGIYDNYHFSEKIVGNAVEFDYLLKDGPSRSTNAIRLLASMGFDRRIVDEATALLDHH
jgi:DNA mismatch repair ATPase MutS